ncbi:MAG: hypothetical protein ISP49_01585 [Reyranella sp.]|nr:hypothetical protein [Reyranella sp.]
MARFDLHEWPLTLLAAALLAASLWLQAVPVQHTTSVDTAVCEKPGLAAMALALSLH